MPRYFFYIRSADSEDHDEDGTALPDDAAALRFDHPCILRSKARARPHRLAVSLSDSLMRPIPPATYPAPPGRIYGRD
jgi:hypothetical protein